MCVAVTQDEARELLAAHEQAGRIAAWTVEGERLSVDIVHQGATHTFRAPLPGSPHALECWLDSRPHWIEQGWV